jgi:hypothetical protein
MANATSLTINALTANSWTTRPAGNVFDTGTVAVTVYGTVDTYKSGAVIVEVSNGGTAVLTATALAGDNPPAFRAGLGSVAGSVAAGSVQIFGPFETGWFGQDDGTFGLTLTPVSGTIAGTVRAYAIPTI